MPECLTSRKLWTTERLRWRRIGSSSIVIGPYGGQLTRFELADECEAERCRRERPMAGLIDLGAGMSC